MLDGRNKCIILHSHRYYKYVDMTLMYLSCSSHSFLRTGFRNVNYEIDQPREVLMLIIALTHANIFSICDFVLNKFKLFIC